MSQTGTFQSVIFEDGKLQSITGCSGYDKYSFEELRINDYVAGNKFAKKNRYSFSPNIKPATIQKKTPLVSKMIHKMTKHDDYMEIDGVDFNKQKKQHEAVISMENLTGPGFASKIGKSLQELHGAKSFGETRDQVNEIPHFSTPNLSHITLSTHHRKATNSPPPTVEEHHVIKVIKRNPDTGNIIKTQTSSIPDSGKLINTAIPTASARPNSLYQAQYHSMSHLSEVLERNNPKEIKYQDSPHKLDSHEDSAVKKKVMKSEPMLERESMLQQMNQELFVQLKGMRNEVEELRTQNKRLTFTVERLSKDLETLSRHPAEFSNASPKTLPRELKVIASDPVQTSSEKTNKRESILSKLTGGKKNDENRKSTLIPKKNERKQKAVHVQPHFNMKLIDDAVKTSQDKINRSSVSLDVKDELTDLNTFFKDSTPTSPSNQIEIMTASPLTATLTEETKIQIPPGSPLSRQVADEYSATIYDDESPLDKSPTNYLESKKSISRTKTILKTQTDTDIVSIIDELNNLAQNNNQFYSNSRKPDGEEGDFADLFLRKLNHLTDSLVQPRLDNVKFVSGNLIEGDENENNEIVVNEGVDVIDEGLKVSVDETSTIFNESSTLSSPIDIITPIITKKDYFVDEETMTDVEFLLKDSKEIEIQTDENEYHKRPSLDQECQTDTLLVMSNALVGQLWKLNEALSIKVNEYDEAMIKQNETVDELRERNKVLWNEVRFMKSKESTSELIIQTLNRREQHQTLVRRDFK